MILVDIMVPSVDKTYDFQLNEQVGISSVIEEICEMIEQKEHLSMAGDISKLELCYKEQGVCLRKNNCLADYKITTGKTLILI